MAYQLAEMLDEAEDDATARQTAIDLTIRLWHHRSDWPDGWLPESTKRQIPWLFISDNEAFGVDLDDVDRFMRSVAKRLTKEYQFWIRVVGATATSDDTNELNRWEPDRIAETIAQLRDLIDAPTDAASDDNSNTDVERLRIQLAALLADRQSMLEEALALNA